MKLLGMAVAVLFLSASTAGAAQSTVDGSVDASWSQPRRISNDAIAVLRAGHVVTVRVSGEVDVNQVRQRRTDCGLLGLDCHVVEWTDHHFVTPQQVPIRVELRQVGRPDPISATVVSQAPVQIQVPIGNSNFQTEYELVAVVVRTGDPIDPATSVGTYKVVLEIDSRVRAQRLPGWLGSAQPTASSVVDASVLDYPMVMAQAGAVATALRDYADIRFPLRDLSARTSHELLVRKAMEIAPGDPRNSLALAAFFQASGNSELAGNLAQQTITQLSDRSDAASRRMLGDAYERLGDMALATQGAVETTASQTAAAYFQQAVSAYRQAGRQDLEARALVKQGRVLRGTRTLAGMATAIEAFSRARTLIPEAIRGDEAVTDPDGTVLWALSTIDTLDIDDLSPTDTSLRLSDAVAVAWDPFSERLLAALGSQEAALEWRSLGDFNNGVRGPAIRFEDTVIASAGAVLSQPRPGQLVYASPNGATAPVPAGQSDTCTPPALTEGLASPPSGYAAVSLGRGGDVIATVCGDVLRVYQVRDSAPVLVKEERFPPAPAITSGSYAGSREDMVVAGPPTCGVAVASITSQPAVPSWTETTTLRLMNMSGSFSTVPLPPMSNGNRAWPMEITFTGDNRMLVARNAVPIQVFDCLRQRLEAPLTPAQPYPLRPTSGPAGGYQSAGSIFRWVSPGILAIIDVGLSEVTLLEWPARTAARFTVSDNLELEELLALIRMPLPPRGTGGPPRIARQVRVITTRLALGTTTTEPATITVPGYLTSLVALNGANLFLQSYGNSTALLDTGAGRQLMTYPDIESTYAGREPDSWYYIEGRQPMRRLAVSPSGDISWEGDFERAIRSIGIVRGSISLAPVSLPSPTTEMQNAAIEAARQAIIEPDTMVSSNLAMLPASEIPRLISDPGRIVLAYHSINGVRPIAGPTGRYLVAFCGTLAALDSSGSSVGLPLNTPAYPLLARLERESVGLMWLPVSLSPAEAGGFPGEECDGVQPVQGQEPMVLDRRPTGQLRRFVDGRWVEIPGRVGSLHGAWSLANGDFFLLDAADRNGPAQTFALKRISRAGGTSIICPQCSALRLRDALSRLAGGREGETASVPVSVHRLRQSRLLEMGSVSTLLLDEAGTLLVYPDGDDSVVWSLTEGRELMRVPLGVPVLLRPDLLVMSDANHTLYVHHLPPTPTPAAPPMTH